MRKNELLEFSDMNHSIHVFDVKGNRLADIDETGVRMYSEELKIAVCKQIGEENGWPKTKMIYMSENLEELLKKIGEKKTQEKGE